MARFHEPVFFFFLNDTATTEIYPLPLHDALPISEARRRQPQEDVVPAALHGAHEGAQGGARGGLPEGVEGPLLEPPRRPLDRKSTRLNSSHSQISYAVFCLKKKNRKANVSSAHCP